MDYVKKVVVLNQVEEGFSISQKRVSAIVRIEIEGGVATLYLSAVNFSAAKSGEYVLYIIDENNKLYSFSLEKRPVSERKVFEVPPKIDGGFSAAVFYVENDLPVMVAFYKKENSDFNISKFKKTVLEKILESKKKVKSAPQEKLSQPPVAEPLVQKEYNDEAVATENYYLKEDDFKEKLKIFEVIDKENVRIQNELPFGASEKKEKEDENCGIRLQNETNDFGGKEYSKEHPYYDSAKAELEEILLKFPSETRLENNLPESRFVKITYSQNKYYVVGIIKEQGKEKYVCYGVPAKYSAEPPKELKGFCSFIPLSVFDLSGDGYWMMFQDAITGECVKKD